MWRLALLTSLIATAVGAQDKQTDVEVSDVDEDLSLDEEELKVLLAEGQEEEKAMDRDGADMSEKEKADENVSFQVRNGQNLKRNLSRSSFASFKNRPRGLGLSVSVGNLLFLCTR